jgi:hypothetical protein
MLSVIFGMTSVVLLAIAAEFFGADPPRPASPRLRSPRNSSAATRRARLRRACDHRGILRRRPAAPGFAALAITAEFFGADPPRPASPRLRSPLS